MIKSVVRTVFGITLAILASLAGMADDQTGPRALIGQLFDGMRAGDGAAIRQLVIDGASLDRVLEDGSLKPGSFENWINWVDQQAPGDADETVFDVVVQEFNGLATVWAPFIIHYKGDLVGCGVNQFTLVRTAEGWRILHGIDAAHDGDCQAYYDARATR